MCTFGVVGIDYLCNVQQKRMTMFEWFSKQKREERCRLKDLRSLSDGFSLLSRLEQGGLLWFDEKNRRLMIEQSLTLVMINTGVEGWANFLRNCFLWQYERECRKAWDKYIRDEELNAVRRAAKKYAMMSRRDIDRVKDARRKEIQEGDIKPPKVEGFEFFVIGGEKPDGDSSSANHNELIPGGSIKAVGWFHPDQEWPEMATWEEVREFIVER